MPRRQTFGCMLILLGVFDLPRQDCWPRGAWLKIDRVAVKSERAPNTLDFVVTLQSWWGLAHRGIPGGRLEPRL